jgi:coniferyl-aldehyde dehydrogenase
VTVNDLARHALSNSMGLGGVGPSGMGRYKGVVHGFEAFSNPKAVVIQSRILVRSSGNMPPPFKSDPPRK